MKKYKSKAFEAIHQEAEAMYEINAISLKEMQEFDKMCLVSLKSSVSRIRTLKLETSATALASTSK